MDVLKIPFVNQVGLKKNSDGVLELPNEPEVQNHLKSIHAGAQFTLAQRKITNGKERDIPLNSVIFDVYSFFKK